MLIGRLISHHARHRAQAVAVVDGARELTFAMLNQRVNRLANALAGLGIGKGDRGAILMRNQHQFLESYFAYSKLGAIAVPINFRLTADEIAYVLDDSGAKVLVMDSEFAAPVAACYHALNAPPIVIATGSVDVPTARDYEATLRAASDDEPSEDALATDDPNLILYTSGTTGFPKGALLSHANQFWVSLNIRHYYGFGETDRSLVTLPLYHTAALNFSVVPFLHVGSSVVLQRAYDPEQVLALIAGRECSSLFILPSMWKEVADQPLHLHRLGSMRHLVSGGALSPLDAIGRLLAVTGGRYSFLMGMTEVGTFLTYLPPEHAFRKNGSIGRETLHTAIRIVDEAMQELPPGDVGEMVIRGPSVFSAYWNKPQETAAAFNCGWFHSGDLVQRDEEGFLYIVDRKKDMIRSGGENIYSVEVERVIDRHPAVAEAAVIGVPDPYWGESVRAIVVLKAGAQASSDDLVAWCRSNLASFKKPRSVAFVDALPRNATGKILKHVLRMRHGQPEHPPEVGQLARG